MAESMTENVPPGNVTPGNIDQTEEMDSLSSDLMENNTGLGSELNMTDAGMKRSMSGCKRKIKKEDKVCGVCGDSALGYNFDAITCESCKAFFRRNAFKEKEMQCVFSDNCSIDRHTRRFCSSCRLKKCITIGMRKDMIMDASERKKRLEKVFKNRQMKKGSGKMKSQDDSGEDEKPIIPAHKIKVESTSGCQDACRDHDQQETMVTSASSSTEIFNTTVPEDAGPDKRKLSPSEINLIESLVSNFNDSIGLINENRVEEDYQSLSFLINSTGHVVHKLIRFAKRIDDFMSLNQDLQIALLKGATLNCIFLRSAWLYCIENDSWITQAGFVPSSILKKTTAHVMSELHNDHVRMCRQMKELAKEDITLYVIMQVISLFSPECANLTNRALISNVQDTYLILLKHHIEANYSYEIARSFTLKLLLKLTEMKQYSEQHGKLLLHANTSELEPILLEIFDLK